MRSLISASLAAFLSIAGAAQQQCTQAPYGQPCGPTLAVSFVPVGSHHQMNLSVQGGFPSSHGLWIWGAQNLVFPIPGSPCNLYTDFVYGHPFMTDGQGAVSTQRAWPASVSGYFRLQAAVVMVENNQLVIRSTNAVLAECLTP